MDEFKHVDSEGMEAESAALEVVRYDAASGLVPVVVQDVSDGHVLMLAYANREALKRTLGTGQAWFWSRSRQSYWHKGETSGNLLGVEEVRVDCDGDTVLYRVRAKGPACHTGRRSCFYRRVQHGVDHVSQTEDGLTAGVGAQALEAEQGQENAGVTALRSALTGLDVEQGARSGPPGSSGEASGLEVLERLWQVVTERDEQRPPGAYTTYLFEHGVDKIAKKVGEEAVEVAIAAKNAVTARDRGAPALAELQNESADLLYHLLVLWRAAGVTPNEVADILNHRAKA